MKLHFCPLCEREEVRQLLAEANIALSLHDWSE
jgi:hypothetical protein